MGSDYIHGFSIEEQDRLYAQALYLEPMVFSGVSYPKDAHVLEVGCGVGAQTQLLLKKFPSIKISAVDLSSSQVERARAQLRREISAGRVSFSVADAARLDFPEGSFTGAFVCWLLEHAPRPVDILKEARRLLKPGAIIHGIEVLNSSLFVYPGCPAVMEYWSALNDRQQALGGDPNVGAKIGNYLKEAGFTDCKTDPYGRHYDQRDRAAFVEMIDYWEILMASAAPELLAGKLIDPDLPQRMKVELAALRAHAGGLFYYTPIKYSAKAPY